MADEHPHPQPHPLLDAINALIKIAEGIAADVRIIREKLTDVGSLKVTIDPPTKQ